jgi:hypothetical protein
MNEYIEEEPSKPICLHWWQLWNWSTKRNYPVISAEMLHLNNIEETGFLVKITVEKNVKIKILG